MTWSTSEVAVCCSNDFGEVGRALAQFVKQASVLDGYHGLIGKILNQLDLLVAKWPYLPAIDRDCTDKSVVLEHRHK